MFRAALTFFATCAALPAAALCSGDSYLARLDDTQRAAITASTQATPNAEGLLWSLTRDDDTLTVVGTMHIYDARLDAIRDRVLPAIRTADLLMVEATSEEELAMQEAFVASPDLYLITDGPTLPDLLEPAVWDKVLEAASDRGLPGFVIAQMQPWYLSLTLGIPACAMADLAAGQRGLDQMLMDEADTAGVPLQALEGWETLIEVLTDGTREEQLAMLQLGLIDTADQQALFVAMLDTYFAEQTAAVWEISNIAARDLTGLSAAEADAQLAQMQDLILDQRNHNWIPIIEAASEAHDDIVVAVGAAHLPGENGILALLAQEGWSLERLP